MDTTEAKPLYHRAESLYHEISAASARAWEEEAAQLGITSRATRYKGYTTRCGLVGQSAAIVGCGCGCEDHEITCEACVLLRVCELDSQETKQEKKKMAKANNTVFVIRGEGSNLEIVKVFRAGEGEGEVKTPAKAAKKFLSEVADDPQHELYSELDTLNTISGHLRPVSVETKQTVTL